jgi:hypothetical protein
LTPKGDAINAPARAPFPGGTRACALAPQRGFPSGKKELSANQAAFRSTQAEDPYETSPNSSLIQYQYLDLISLYCA